MIRIGTRASPLAMIQADIVRHRLQKSDPTLVVDIIPFTTRGDCTTKSLHDIGGKALFTKELQDALLSNEIDGAVHSLKDVEYHTLPLVLGAYLKRDDARDVLIAKKNQFPERATSSACLGTCSPRRTAQAKGVWPRLSYVDIRGNVGTRLNHVVNGAVDFTILAAAGLKRLGLVGDAFLDAYPMLQQTILPIQTFVPAAGQGVIAVECCPEKQYLFDVLNDPQTQVIAQLERDFAVYLGGNCRTALGVYVDYVNDVKVDQAVTTEPLLMRVFHEGRYYEKNILSLDPFFISSIFTEILKELNQK